MAERPFTYLGRDGRWVRVYLCDVCKRPFEWGPESMWYGSIKDQEDCNWKAVAFYCSLACRVGLKPDSR